MITASVEQFYVSITMFKQRETTLPDNYCVQFKVLVISSSAVLVSTRCADNQKFLLESNPVLRVSTSHANYHIMPNNSLCKLNDLT